MSDDLISRQAAIDALNDEYHGMISDESMKIYQIVEWLNTLPSAQPEITETQVKEYCKKRCLVVLDSEFFHRLTSAQPEQKTGNWMLKRVRDDGHGTVTFQVICSKCGEPAYEFNQPYCHHCGAKMND